MLVKRNSVFRNPVRAPRGTVVADASLLQGLRKAPRELLDKIDSSVAHALALSGLPVYVASSQLDSIHSLFVPSRLGALRLR
jgi:hypothetical protein